jgi:hypothetical protein
MVNVEELLLVHDLFFIVLFFLYCRIARAEDDLILSIFVFIKRTTNKAIITRINTQKCNGFYKKKNISQILQNIFQFYFDFKLTIKPFFFKPFFPSFNLCLPDTNTSSFHCSYTSNAFKTIFTIS